MYSKAYCTLKGHHSAPTELIWPEQASALSLTDPGKGGQQGRTCEDVANEEGVAVRQDADIYAGALRPLQHAQRAQRQLAPH